MQRIAFGENWFVRGKSEKFGMLPEQPEKAVQLPHDAVICSRRSACSDGGSQKGYYNNGAWQYRKRFFVPGEWRDKKTILEFDGIYRNASIYVNGDLAAQGGYGYSLVLTELDPFLVYGAENEIKIQVRTGDDSRWYTGAGIYRDVKLLLGSQIYIVPNETRVTTEDLRDDNAVLRISAILKNESSAGQTITAGIEITDPEGRIAAAASCPVTLEKNGESRLEQRLDVAEVRRWSTETPQLYRCRITLENSDGVLDREEERFGIRVLGLSHARGLEINGESVKLRGACIHHDNGLIGAVSVKSAERWRLSKLKGAGFNAIRMAHQPAGKALLEVCDELGLLVMDEAFDMWTVGKSTDDYSADFPDRWRRDVRAMVARDFNHPSVIIYSLGNEIPETGSPKGALWCRRIADYFRELDRTRYTTVCVNGMFSVMDLLLEKREKDNQTKKPECGEINTMMASIGAELKTFMQRKEITVRTEEAFGCVDIAGYNYMDSRYEMDRELFPNRIICGTETYSRDIASNWSAVLRYPELIGDFTWTGWDYLGEAGIGKIHYGPEKKTNGIYCGYPTFLAYTGDHDITGRRNPVSYYREIVFGLRREPYIAVQPPKYNGVPVFLSPWSWSNSISSWSWTGYEGAPVKVEVYAPQGEVELFLNGHSLGRKRIGPGDKNMAVFDAVYAPGILTAVAGTEGESGCSFSLQTACGGPRLTVSREDDESLREDGDLLYFAVSLLDEYGTPILDRDTRVEVKVEGAGKLLALGSGDPDSEEIFSGEACRTYLGRALAIVSPLGKGELRVTARADGMPPAELTLRI